MPAGLALHGCAGLTSKKPVERARHDARGVGSLRRVLARVLALVSGIIVVVLALAFAWIQNS
jgi:hypothetical protein